MYKLSFYVPESHLEPVKDALFAAGAGRYQAYDQCCWQVPGQGQFRPLAHSRPYLGQPHRLEKVKEYKVEMICEEAVIQDAVRVLLNTHPYEQPAYEIYKILSIDEI